MEVFEINDKQVNTPTIVVDTNTKKKLRPNDKVSVRYQDGSVKMQVKYKTVKDDIDQGKARIF